MRTGTKIRRLGNPHVAALLVTGENLGAFGWLGPSVLHPHAPGLSHRYSG
jgi:hypothetical protein